MFNQTDQNQGSPIKQNNASNLPEFMTPAAGGVPQNQTPPADLSQKAQKVLGNLGGGGQRKKVIATILGILILVVGVGAGVTLVQQQQELRKKAVIKCDGWANPGEVHCNTGQCQQYTCGSNGQWEGPQGTGVCASHPDCQRQPPSDPTGGQCSGHGGYSGQIATYLCPDGCEGVCNQNFSLGDNLGTQCGQTDYLCKDNTGVVKELRCAPFVTECAPKKPSPRPSPTPTPTPIKAGPTPTPTSIPGISAQCLDIKVFDKNWKQIAAADLAKLKPNAVVRFTVAGSATGGSFDMARFKINGTQRNSVTAKRPGTQEFYDEYTIPEIPTGQTLLTITVNAELHHSTLGWL